MLGKRNWRLILLLALAVMMMLVLTSCDFHFTISGVLPTTPVESVLVVSSESYSACGYIYISGINTGIYLWPFQSKTIYGVSCYKNISIFLVDTSGFSSYTIYIYTKPGINGIKFY